MSCSDTDGCEVERELRARLAAVLVLCDEARSGAFDSRVSFESAVRAAARGEGNAKPAGNSDLVRAELLAAADDIDSLYRSINQRHPDSYLEGKLDGLGIAEQQLRVRAAARGEGDQPAECRNPQTHTPGCGCKALDEFPPIKPMADPDDDDAWDRLNLPTARGEGDR